MMQMTHNVTTPTPIITLCIPSGAIQSAQKSEAIRCSLHRLRGCFGSAYRNGSEICVQFDGTQTTADTVRKLALRMLTREQSDSIQLTVTVHWEFTIVLMTDVDSRSRGIISAKLRHLLPDCVALRWQGDREVRVASPIAPDHHALRQQITAAGFAD